MRHPQLHSEIYIQFVQHCAPISVIAELLFYCPAAAAATDTINIVIVIKIFTHCRHLYTVINTLFKQNCFNSRHHKCLQVAQLSQRDRAAGWVSNGQKWKTGTERQYLRTI